MYLVDTNILIYHFNNEIPHDSRIKVHQIFQEHFNISIITKMEFLGFKGHTQDSFAKSKIFIEYASIIGIDDNIVASVIQMRRGKSIKLPDAIIAATCIHHDYTLVTRNQGDFSGLSLRIYNPFQ